MKSKYTYKITINEGQEHINFHINEFTNEENDIFFWYYRGIIDIYHNMDVEFALDCGYEWDNIKTIIQFLETAKDEKDSSKIIYKTSCDFGSIEIYKDKSKLINLIPEYYSYSDDPEYDMSFMIDNEDLKMITIMWFKEIINYRYGLGLMRDSDKDEILKYIEEHSNKM